MTLNRNLGIAIEFCIPKNGINDVSYYYGETCLNHLFKYGGHFENDVIAKRSIGKIFYFFHNLTSTPIGSYRAINLIGAIFFDSLDLRLTVYC